MDRVMAQFRGCPNLRRQDGEDPQDKNLPRAGPGRGHGYRDRPPGPGEAGYELATGRGPRRRARLGAGGKDGVEHPLDRRLGAGHYNEAGSYHKGYSQHLQYLDSIKSSSQAIRGREVSKGSIAAIQPWGRRLPGYLAAHGERREASG